MMKQWIIGLVITGVFSAAPDLSEDVMPRPVDGISLVLMFNEEVG